MNELQFKIQDLANGKIKIRNQISLSINITVNEILSIEVTDSVWKIRLSILNLLVSQIASSIHNSQWNSQCNSQQQLSVLRELSK